LNTYTLEQEFTALTTVFGYQDRSTSEYSGFTILMSQIPGVSTNSLYRMYFGIAFDSPLPGIQTDMGYRYLTTDLNEAITIEGFGPPEHRAERDGTYFREQGVNSGTAILGYIYSTAQPGTSEMFQIYRTDLFDKDTRTGPPGTPATGTVQQQQGDHVYTTKSAFEMTMTPDRQHIEGVQTGWRQEASRGFVRELSAIAGGAAAPARSASVQSAPAETFSPTASVVGGWPLIRQDSSLDRLATQFATPDSRFFRTSGLTNVTNSNPAWGASSWSSRMGRNAPVVQTSHVESICLRTQLGPDLAPATDTVFSQWQELVDSLP
jgi:hypothetical protein